jgi:hypothetical protein
LAADLDGRETPAGRCDCHLLEKEQATALGGGKWGAGPTAVLLKLGRGWTFGLLANHLWSFAGTHSRADVNATFLQPFISYTTKTHTTLGLNAESIYDWVTNHWTVPVNLTVSRLLKLGSQPVQLGRRKLRGVPLWRPRLGPPLRRDFLVPEVGAEGSHESHKARMGPTASLKGHNMEARSRNRRVAQRKGAAW